MMRLMLAAAALCLAGCNGLEGLTGSQPLPSGTPDPKTFRTPAGAMEMYWTAVYSFQYATTTGTSEVFGVNGGFVDAMLATGVLSDELETGDLGGPPQAYLAAVSSIDSLDGRNLVEGVTSGDPGGLYNELQGIRTSTTIGIGALNAYAPASPRDLRGQLFALRGYAEILLGDLFCSGVPLSTINFNGDYTYQPSSTTTQVYQNAVAQFDSALTLTPDSARFQHLAQVGRGRALLAEGQYAEAAQAVAAVPDNFQYQFEVNWSVSPGESNRPIFATWGGQSVNGGSQTPVGVTVADREGLNGLPFISSNDPRSAVQAGANSPNQYGRPAYVPVKYGGTALGVLPITVADGIEARLIEAEAALQQHDYATWLAKLNHARSLAAGGLALLTDPGSDTARTSLLFQERAYDLFLTAHRQGDLRRLIRQYHRGSNAVYPTGLHGGGVPAYGGAVNVPIPRAEDANPLFHGCLDRGA